VCGVPREGLDRLKAELVFHVKLKQNVKEILPLRRRNRPESRRREVVEPSGDQLTAAPAAVLQVELGEHG
jgi:hypothetical protein